MNVNVCQLVGKGRNRVFFCNFQADVLMMVKTPLDVNESVLFVLAKKKCKEEFCRLLI